MGLEALNLEAVATGIVGLVSLFFYAFNEAQIKALMATLKRAVKPYSYNASHAKKVGMHRWKRSEPSSPFRLDGSRRVAVLGR